MGHRWLALGVGIVLVSALPRTLHAPTSTTPRIAVIVPEEPGTWLLGARLGMEEARRAADLLRRELDIMEIAAERDAATVVARQARAGTVVLVAALDGPAWHAFEEAATTHDLVLVDARPSHASAVSCPSGVFRVGLPADPEGTRRPLALWHDSLNRYGATQLNDRFRRRFGQGMDGAAWAAWLAVKVSAEALLRVERAETSTVAAYLTSRAATFDGHKGQPLRFDPSHRYLVQPVYRMDDSGSPEEIPWTTSPTCAAPAQRGAP